MEQYNGGGVSATLPENIEQRMGQEAGAKTGYLLPVPLPPDSPALVALKTQLGNLVGGVALVESVGPGRPGPRLEPSRLRKNLRVNSHGEPGLE